MDRQQSIEQQLEDIRKSMTWWDHISGFFYRLKECVMDFFRGIKWFIQRGRRGYSDRDLWGFSSYLSEMLVQALTQLNETKMGYPADIKTSGQWTDIIDEMIEGFRAVKDNEEIFFTDKTNQQIEEEIAENNRRIDRGMYYFKKYFQNLWD